jgi:hypothetical protein
MTCPQRNALKNNQLRAPEQELKLILLGLNLKIILVQIGSFWGMLVTFVQQHWFYAPPM